MILLAKFFDPGAISHVKFILGERNHPSGYSSMRVLHDDAVHQSLMTREQLEFLEKQVMLELL